jgi:hypothetical protein
MNVPTTKISTLASALGAATTSDSSPQPSRSSTTLSGTSVVGSGDNSVSTFPTPRGGDAKPQRTSSRDDVRRRRGGLPRSHPPGPRVAPPAARKVGKITHREYRLLQSQTLLLLGTASLGLALFLLFTLPFAALVGLTVMVTSMGACLLVASSAAKAWYELQLEHPLGLIRHLPPTARTYLTQKSLNEVLCPSCSAESLPSLLSTTLSRHNSSSRGSLSSLPQEQQHRQRRGGDRVTLGNGRPPQANDARSAFSIVGTTGAVHDVMSTVDDRVRELVGTTRHRA